jgi:7-cyano-7-deazaguanine synthase in queuosine biosynthesis
MSSTVRFDISWYSSEPVTISFGVDEYKMVLADGGPLGRSGLSPEAADLLELAAAIAWMERRLPRRRQPPIAIAMRFPVRNPARWTPQVLVTLVQLLAFVGDAHWSIDVVRRRSQRRAPDHHRSGQSIDQFTLFSAGLDSTTAIAVQDPKATRLTSFYSRQKTKQRDIAKALGHQPPLQWRLDREPGRNPGRSFRYRGFFFLCMAAATASSFDCRRIIQAENGILATGIPPSPAWLMTKHAHPRLHSAASDLFSGLLGDTWQVLNPYATMTKRQCVEAAQETNPQLTQGLLKQTDSCWHLWANLVPGANRQTVLRPKKPGRHCGTCIPCLIRRTALRDREYALDLSKPTWQDHERFGRDFRAYYGFLEQIRASSFDDFYFVLPAPGRLLYSSNVFGARALYDLFNTFADEFLDVFA